MEKEKNEEIETSLKKSLINQERFLLEFIQFERIFKKYKKVIIMSIIVLVSMFALFIIQDSLDFAKKLSSNEAYDKLLKNPNDKEAINILKANSESLYNIYMANQAIKNDDIESLKNIKLDALFEDLISYKIASLKANHNSLQRYALRQSSSLKEYADIQLTFKMIQDGKYEDAKFKLENTPVTSSLNTYYQLLRHYLVTKTK